MKLSTFLYSAISTLFLISCSSVENDHSSTDLRTVQALQSGISQHIVVYGTSLTARGRWIVGFQTSLEQTYPGQILFTNCAKSGMGTEWGRKNIADSIIAKKPDCVCIEFVMNDPRHGTSLIQSRENMIYMIELIKEKIPHCELVLMTMNSAETTEEMYLLVNEYYDMIRELSVKYELPLLDINRIWENLRETDPDTYFSSLPDGVHPNEVGTRTVILPTVRKFFSL